MLLTLPRSISADPENLFLRFWGGEFCAFLVLLMSPLKVETFRVLTHYSIDAICIGLLFCTDRTLLKVMPMRNIAISVTAITLSYRRTEMLSSLCKIRADWRSSSIKKDKNSSS